MTGDLLIVLLFSGSAAIGLALSIYFMRRFGIAANLTGTQRLLLFATLAASIVPALLITSGRPGIGIGLLVLLFVVPSWVSTVMSMRRARRAAATARDRRRGL